MDGLSAEARERWRFHIRLEPRPPGARRGALVMWEGHPVPALDVSPTELAAACFPVRFEEALDRLARLDRLYTEPDGSFVWRSEDAEGVWLVNGMMYDHQGRVRYVELKGSCAERHLDDCWTCFGWPDQPVIIQDVVSGWRFDEATFRTYVARGLATGRPME